jgi:hypothetical protein
LQHVGARADLSSRSRLEARRSDPRGRNATWGRVGRKQTKINKSKTAFFCFLLLTFIFSNRDFSMSYNRFKQKNFSVLNSRDGLYAEVSNARASPFRPVSRSLGFHPLVGNCIAHDLCFCQAETLETLNATRPPTNHSPGAMTVFRPLRISREPRALLELTVTMIRCELACS